MLGKLRKTIQYIHKWYNNSKKGTQGLPTILSFPITNRCNFRCVMCDLWKAPKAQEMNLIEIEQVLKNPLFKNIRHTGLSGGEPALRTDIVDIVKITLEALPKLESLSITSNGFYTEKWASILPEISALCKQKCVDFKFNLSIDGIEETHNRVRGITRSFSTLRETISVANKLGIKVQLQCTVSAYNVYSIGRLLKFAEDTCCEIIYRKATQIARLENDKIINSVEINDEESSFFSDYLLSDSVQKVTRSLGRRLFYKELAERLISKGQRKAPCYFQREGIVLGANGDLFLCSLINDSIGNALNEDTYELYFSSKRNFQVNKLLKEYCTGCEHDQSGAWHPIQVVKEILFGFSLWNKLNKFIRIIKFLLNSSVLIIHGFWIELFRQNTPAPNTSNLSKPKSALLVGCYGGEHVGDAAILGGVLFRIQKEFMVQSVYLASVRPHRTRRWVKSLNINIPINVIPYETDYMKNVLKKTDIVVFAGGPLMDLPELLVKHLQTVILARYRSIPVVLEGIGIGPFKLLISKVMAQRIIRLSQFLRVRTTKSARSNFLKGKQVNLAPDPAFDYLNTVNQELNLTFKELESLNALFAGTENRFVVGLNLRPLWNKYAGSNMSSSQVESIENEFIRKLAKSLVDFSQAEHNVTYVFFPMNPDQYGFSDLTIAYALQQLLPVGIDFRIWEFEAGIDAMVDFLRRTQLCITMRFHASIFSISQNIPTIGIDYGICKPSKVTELFYDNKLTDFITSVDRFEPEWLTTKMQVVKTGERKESKLCSKTY